MPYASYKQNISGKIKSITDFGIFIGLPGGIDGLVHLSDLSWKEAGEEAVRNYKKGDELEAVILGIDPERERISLGIKQLENDPYNDFIDENPKGTVISGKITTVEQKRAMVFIAEEIEGIIRIGEFSREHIEDLRDHLKVDEEIDAKVLGIDRKHHMINLSIKELHSSGVADKNQADEPQANTLGDILKEKMQGSDD